MGSMAQEEADFPDFSPPFVTGHWTFNGDRLPERPRAAHDPYNNQVPVKQEDAPPHTVDKPMEEAEELPVPLSVIDDYEQIASNELLPIDEEILELKCSHWEITNWSQLDDRVQGQVFEAAGYKWNVLLFPRGNNQNESASIYLELTEAKTIPDLYSCAQFVICVSRPSEPTRYVSHSAQHRFNAEESDWGFTRFIQLRHLHATDTKGEPAFLENDSLRITAIVRVIKDPTGVLWHNFIKLKMTGYVGLKNQGATCYMNSLFQSLYCTNYFRKAVYQIPTENDEPTKSVALALQRVFYNLQFHDTSVGTTELTKSFGWDSLEAFMQHDVQEFNRVLQDNLEAKMKNTPADGAIKKLFVGRMKSYIKCINVNYESSRSEDYYDIQLNVKGCESLEKSFKDYIDVETLEGDNKYMAEGYGLQDAKKGVIFESFPPVLHLQLKRFEYDIMRDTMVKINDRHEFPLEMDLEPYLDKDADRSEPHQYVLHGVLVHSGDLTGGHYFAFVKPTKDGKWLKFDDDRVVPATLKEVLEENYGGEHTNGLGVNGRQSVRYYKRVTNAYMLVYIRKSMLDEILGEVSLSDIPRHLVDRIEEERQLREKKLREKELQHLFMKAFVFTDKTFNSNEGFDFVNFEEKSIEETHFQTLRVRKDQTYRAFKHELGENLGVPEANFRLWFLVSRQNRTVRPDTPVPDEEENCTLEELRRKHLPNQPHLRLYVETATQFENGRAVFPDTTHVLVFVKLFDPFIQKIKGMGRLYVPKSGLVSSVLEELNKIVGYEPTTAITLYEEIKPQMIEEMNINSTFSQAEIQDGDIICVQKQLTDQEIEDLEAQEFKTTVPDFMDYQIGKVNVLFSPRDEQSDMEFELTLHKNMKYEKIAAKVADKLGADAEKIRFFVPGGHDGLKPIRRTSKSTLQDIYQSMYNPGQLRPKLIYEVLDMTVMEFESQRLVKVTVCTPTLKDCITKELLMPKQSRMSDLIKALDINGVKFESASGTRSARIFEAIDNKFHREFLASDSLSMLAESPNAQLYVEEIPEEELTMADEDFFVPVFHFQRDVHRTHSVPFKFAVRKDEPFSKTKKRLQERVGLNDKDWSKVKFNIVSSYSAAPIDDDDFKLSDHQFNHEDSLGLDHIDKSARVNRGGAERALFIRG